MCVLKDKSLIELVDMLDRAESQEDINRVVKEIVYRLYIPFGERTFEELLIEFGYRPIENDRKKGK